MINTKSQLIYISNNHINKKHKKAFFYSIDAIVALLLILTLIIIIAYTPNDENSIRHLPSVSEDLLTSLSVIKVSDSKNPLLMEKILNNEISNREKDMSILGYVAELWAMNKSSEANEIITNITFYLPIRGIELSVENDLIFKSSNSNKGTVASSSRIITGVSKNVTQKGISAKSYLTGIGNKITSDFVFFGGFVGQGNISKNGIVLPSDANVSVFNFEADIKSDSKLYVNDIFCSNLTKNANEPNSEIYNLIECKDSLNFGIENNFKIYFNSSIEDSYIGGGLITIKYATDKIIDNSLNESVYNIPGISGIINLYSSINSIEEIKELEAYIHVNINHSKINNATFFVNIGNKTIYSNNSLNGEENILLTNNYISTKTPYNLGSTIPIRIGFENISYNTNSHIGNADVILITDLSGSMDRCINNNNACSTGCPGSMCRIDLAKTLTKQFTDNLLNTSGNRIALVTYSYNAQTRHILSNNATSVKSVVDSFSPSGATCIGCAIRESRRILETNSNSSRQKYIIVMTDGIGNMRTQQTNQNRTTCCSSGYCANPTCGRSLNYDATCSDYIDNVAKTSSINDACFAHSNTNATIHSVGFGSASIGCNYAIDFLDQIANCGNGQRYSSNNVSGLQDIYSNLASEIVASSSISQVTSIDLNNITTKLFDDSYIKFKTNKTKTISNSQISLRRISEKFNSCTPTINIEDIEITDAQITSFSSNFWTDKVDVNSQNIFNLSHFSATYANLGDPFIISVPNLISNSNNNILINIGDSPVNSSGCSNDSRLIYNVLIDTTYNLDNVYTTAEGCIWNLTYYDNTNDTISAPKDYTGNKTCSLISYNHDDAIDNSVYNLLQKLDIDNDGKIDIKFNENNFKIETIQINEIPDLTGPSKVTVKIW